MQRCDRSQRSGRLAFTPFLEGLVLRGRLPTLHSNDQTASCQTPVSVVLVRCALCFVLSFTDNRSLITDDYPATHNPNTLTKHDAPSTKHWELGTIHLAPRKSSSQASTRASSSDGKISAWTSAV